MTEQFAKAKAFITTFAESLLPDAEQLAFTGDDLRVAKGVIRFSVPFSRADLEDLEPTLHGHLPTKYSEGLKSASQLRVCLAFLQERLVPNLNVSTIILNEKRDWITSVRWVTHFDAKLAEQLYLGLQTLESYLNQTLQKHGAIPAVRRDLEIVKSMTDYYRENKHLHTTAERESLSFLRAAAVVVIMELEDKRNATNAARVKDSYNDEILSIAQVIESRPFDRIKLPNALYDYVADNGSDTQRTAVSSLPRQNPFGSEIEDLLRPVDARLVDRRRGAWEALDSENPDGVSQAANSMVEVLDRVIASVCESGGVEFKDFLATKLSSEGQSDWVVATRKWIGLTKDNLHSIKHHTIAQPKELTRALMISVELIVRIVLG